MVTAINERAKEYAEAYDPNESAMQYAVERAYGVGASDQDPISRADERKKVIENAVQLLEREYAYNGSMAVINPEFITMFKEELLIK